MPYTSEPIDVLKVKKEEQQILQKVKSLSSPESGVCVPTEHFPSFFLTESKKNLLFFLKVKQRSHRPGTIPDLEEKEQHAVF